MTENHPLPDRMARRAVRALGRLPRPLKRAIAGKPIVVDGQQLDLDAQVGVRMLNLTVGDTFENLPLDEGRRQIDSEAWVFGYEHPVREIREVTLPRPGGDLPARVYRSAGAAARSAALVYFHGGGWVLGNLGSADSVARYLASQAGITVISVDYRLAPEHPFPAAVDDAVAAFRHVVDHADDFGVHPDAVGVSGESAGGNLAAVVALSTMLEARRDPLLATPSFQLLFMPVTDLTTKHRSYELFSEGYFLSEAQMDWYKGHYLSDPTEAADPRVSPLLAPDLTGVAPAHVVVAGFDVLRDEGEAYAERLLDAGVPTTLTRHAGIVHGLVNATGVGSVARRALDDAVAQLRRRLVPLAAAS